MRRKTERQGTEAERQLAWSREYLRREKRRAALSMTVSLDDEAAARQAELPDERYSPHRQLEQIERSQAIRDGLDALSPEHRQVLVLREMHQMSYQEISDVLDLDVGTVKSRISRAKMRLRELLDGSGNLFDGGGVLQTEISERREQP